MDRKQAPGYMTYREAAIMFSLMPETDAAQAIKATVNYFLYKSEPPELSDISRQVFNIMRADIDRNDEKYAKTVARNKDNRQKGIERARDEKVLTSGQPVVNQSSTSGRQTLNLKLKTINNKPEADVSAATPPTRARARFTPPTESEAIDYFTSHGSTAEEAGRFCDFYGAKNWMIGKKKMADWHKAASGWIRRAKDEKRGGCRVQSGTDYEAAARRLQAKLDRGDALL